MRSPDFEVHRIVAVSFGSDGKRKPYLIVEDAQGERVFVPGETLDQSVGEIDAVSVNSQGSIPGSTLNIRANETYGVAIKVSQVPTRVPRVKPPVS